jgi:hypothetical protein
MTQRQITHPAGTLPACAAGHAARHIHDMRCASAGGGHFVECECRRTARHAEIDAALVEWKRLNRHRKPRTPKAEPIQRDAGKPRRRKDASTVLQFPLPLSGSRT